MFESTTVPTKYWHKLADGRVQCDLCPRYCKLNEGQRGLCFVRAREEDQIVLTTYGRSSGFCIDPIEKKPLNHFFPGTSVLSFGTAGCNLFCRFCQNWDISKSREIDTLADAASPQTIARAAQELGCRSVAFTYNDPVIFLEYAVDVAQACREAGIKSVAVTAGYINAEPRAEFFTSTWMPPTSI
jgi:pyruvate formate lyase activating enzyme